MTAMAIVIDGSIQQQRRARLEKIISLTFHIIGNIRVYLYSSATLYAPINLVTNFIGPLSFCG
jgi:membrane-anchored protein YejM (alkaline phosphatase superfamily)